MLIEGLQTSLSRSSLWDKHFDVIIAAFSPRHIVGRKGYEVRATQQRQLRRKTSVREALMLFSESKQKHWSFAIEEAVAQDTGSLNIYSVRISETSSVRNV
uniref:Uncharacterized protein n=1 Tax=Rhodosorus marinus TaxID=101924 RepID=A0A7S2ZRK1_9RHOD|mmetsp:Transcript_285/g.695  ORF Transcript_285/g.695 Transcript_285/m.695 type:complete len:101 (+) Transcript_285:182-484(+)